MRSNKIGFEMEEEERALHILDTVLDVSLAQFSEGFRSSVLTAGERLDMENYLQKLNGITSEALERYEED